jgi:hypothetical protein
MDSKKLTLEGHNYIGRFEIEEHVHSTRERVDTEVGWHWENQTYRHYTGEGLVKDKQTGSEQRFLIYPEGNTEAHLIVLKNGTRERIRDYQGVVDLSLKKMCEDAKNSGEIIPKVNPVCLEEAILSEKGLVSTSEGALRN